MGGRPTGQPECHLVHPAPEGEDGVYERHRSGKPQESQCAAQNVQNARELSLE